MLSKSLPHGMLFLFLFSGQGSRNALPFVSILINNTSDSLFLGVQMSQHILVMLVRIARRIVLRSTYHSHNMQCAKQTIRGLIDSILALVPSFEASFRLV